MLLMTIKCFAWGDVGDVGSVLLLGPDAVGSVGTNTKSTQGDEDIKPWNQYGLLFNAKYWWL